MSTTVKLSKITDNLPKEDRQKIEKAWHFACENLSSIHRRSGETYAEHGLEVAITLMESTNDATILSIAILHDLLLHENGEKLLKNAPLKKDQHILLRKMFNLRRLHIDENTTELDVVLEAFMEDPRLLLLRMAHRLNDVRNLNRFNRALAKKIADETLHMYTSIAGRLGMYAWRYEMEDICFAVMQPKIALSLKKRFFEYKDLDNICLLKASEILEKKLRERGIACKIEARIKNLYSTYRKMISKNRKFEELYDRLALRIIVENQEDCYLALAVVHEILHPIPGKLKDYIGAPKENGYSSIHTVVYPLPGITQQPIEIQIRTENMHRMCEYGSAVHGDYKNSLYAINAGKGRVDLFRNLERIRKQARSPQDFELALRTYFSEQNIIIFDHDGRVNHCKKPVTALDFVYEIYPKQFKKLKQIRVNGKKCSFGTQLHDGDTVEASFGRNKSFSKEWVEDCFNKSTKQNIRKSLKKIQSEKKIA